VHYDVDERVAGKSKYSFRRMAMFAVTGITSFSMLPLRLSLAAGFLGALACVAYGVYAIAVRLFTDTAMPGWASLVVLLSFINALQLIFIGLLGEYIGKIFEEVKQRPIYIVSSTFPDDE
jgi:glycosyltransferase involved in cell wall biosynthesis